jgi:hypothetical protein
VEEEEDGNMKVGSEFEKFESNVVIYASWINENSNSTIVSPQKLAAFVIEDYL